MSYLYSRAAKAVLLGALCAGVLSSCASTADYKPGNAVPGASLDAQGDKIVLAFTPNSPLAMVAQRNSQLELVASYMSEGGQVSGERIATATLQSPRNNEARGRAVFTLPQTLRNPPTGPICLRMKTPGRRGQAIPIRFTDLGGSPDGFSYAPWDNYVQGPTARKIVERELDIEERNLDRLENARESYVAWGQSNNISSAAGCQAMSAKPGAARPRNVIPASRHPKAAVRQCVFQFDDVVDWVEIGRGRRNQMSAGEVAGIISAGVSSSNDRARARQLSQDIAAHQDVFAPGYEPLLRNKNEFGLGGPTILALRDGGGLIDNNIGVSILDAYDTCQREAIGEFKQSASAWAQEEKLDISGAQTRILRKECRENFEGLATVDGQIARVKARRDAARQKSQALGNAQTPLPSEKISLLKNSCF